METDYDTFLDAKTHLGSMSGFKPLYMPDFLFPFQRALTEWAIEKGRCAIFADCGLGKTPMQLVWAQNVVQKTNKPVLILTPLAVGQQTIREARACILWSNPGEIVFTPFMGVGSEAYGAVINGRKAIGAELKTAYYNQAVRNLAEAKNHTEQELISV